MDIKNLFIFFQPHRYTKKLIVTFFGGIHQTIKTENKQIKILTGGNND